MKIPYKIFSVQNLSSFVIALALIAGSIFSCKNPTSPNFDVPLSGSVSITGIPQIEEILEADIVYLDGKGQISYQWWRHWWDENYVEHEEKIPASSEYQYKVTEADNNCEIFVEVTRSGFTGSVFSYPTAPVIEPDTPILADFEIDIADQTFGSDVAVTIEPKSGKSSGDITIFYNGYKDFPANAGTYEVTFDIAAVYGWRKASFIAGELTINKAAGEWRDPVISTVFRDNFTLGDVSPPLGYTWIEDTATPLDVSKSGQKFDAIYNDPSGNYESITGKITVFIVKGNKDFKNYTIEITYTPELTLGDLTFDEEGYAWDDLDAATLATILNAGSWQFPAIYEDPEKNFEMTKGNITVNVKKATRSFGTVPPSLFNNLRYSYGLTLGNLPVSLPAGYGWDNSATPVYAGTSSYPATRTDPDDNYEPVSGTITFSVAPAQGVYIYHPAINTVYTPTLTLQNMTPNLQNGYTWKFPATALSASNLSHVAIYAEDPNYEPAPGNVVVNVARAEGTFQAYTISGIEYEPSLFLSAITPPENYKWVTGNITVNAGSGQKFPATYTDPSGNYTEATGNITVNVNQAPGVWESHPGINTIYTSGMTLTNIPLPADYKWNVPGTSLSAGPGQYSATYTDPSENYLPATGNITVNVAKAAANFGTVTVINTTYTSGMTLANVSLPSGYAWDAPGTVLNVAKSGMQFDAHTTNPNYETANGKIIVNIAKAAGSFGSPDVINTKYASGLTLGNMTPNLAAGYAWNAPGTSLSAGTGQYSATYTDPSDNYEPASGNITVNVAKADGIFVTPDLIDITYSLGLTLAKLTLPVNYIWADPETPISIDGDGQEFLAIYTDPSGNYTEANGNITVNVEKGEIGFGDPALIIVTYIDGMTLASVATPTGYTWKNQSTVLSAGTRQYPATFKDPSGLYNPVDGNITVLVNKATAGFGKPAAITTTYTPVLTLASITNLPAGYTWKTPTTALNANTPGGQQFPATYTKNSNYEPVDGNITVIVNKATGSFGTPSAINTTYAPGLTLDVLSCPSGYAWVASTTPLDVSKSGQSFPATYTDPSGNYNPASGSITVNVTKAQGIFVSAGAITATYTANMTLANVSLPAGYSWNNSATPVNNAGDGQRFPAIYTDPSGNYTAVDGNITANVAKAQGVFGSPGTITPVTYITGITLAYVPLFNGFAWADPTTPLSAGTRQYPATYTHPSGNYLPANGQITVTVQKAPGDFGLPAAVDTVYTPTLTLANVTLPDGYEFNNKSTSLDVSKSGQLFDATYTDTSGNYESAAGKITVNVAKALSNFGTPPALTTTYKDGLTLGNMTPNLAAGSGYTWNTPATALNAGNNQTFPATFLLDSNNYLPASGPITVNVAKAPGPAFPSYAAITATYNDNGESWMVLRHIPLQTRYTWVEPETKLTVGSWEFNAEYTQSNNYLPSQGKISVTIKKATGFFGPIFDIPTIYTYTQGLKLGDISFPEPGYSWQAPGTALSAGYSLFAVDFADPSGNYTTVSGLVGVRVKQATTAFVPLAARSIVYKPGLTLAGVSLPGAYKWAYPGTSLNVSKSGQSFTAVYTEPSGNYEDIEGGITVIVTKAAGAAVDISEIGIPMVTYNTIQIYPAKFVDDPPKTDQDIEYAVNMSTATPGSGWQDDLIFVGLFANSNYYIFARSAGNDNYMAGDAARASPVKTLIREEFEISYDKLEDIADIQVPALHLVGNPTDTEKVITVTGQYAGIKWFFNGAEIVPQDEQGITNVTGVKIKPQSSGAVLYVAAGPASVFNSKGNYFITLEAQKDGRTYSKVIIITVDL